MTRLPDSSSNDAARPAGGRRVLRHAAVDSTNERALAAVSAGSARHGDWHVAAEQTSGRGRRGARWQSPRGEGLYASLVLLPAGATALRPPALTMAAGLGALEAVRRLGLARVALKWPNDLVLGRAKLAGILVEARGFEPARPHFAVGLGVNVRQRSFPAALSAERPVTSLALEGLETSVDALFEVLAPAVEAWLERALAGTEPATRALERAYLAATGLEGRRVRVASGARTRAGRLCSLDLVQGLRLVDEDGAEARIPLEHVARLEAL